MNGGHLMRMRKYEASVLRSERMIIFAFALWAVYLWGVEPFLHYRHVGGF